MCCKKVLAFVATIEGKNLQSRSHAKFCINTVALGLEGSSVDVPESAPEFSKSTQNAGTS